jgi:RNA 2',3'-cyclic 3'-phosphodiesterase
MSDAKRGNPSETMVRTFICIDIPEAIKARIEKLQGELRRPDTQISWVKPANIHLTLRFLGDVPQARIPLINTAVSHAIGSCRPFQVTIGSTGGFPNLRNPSVLWIGIAPLVDELRNLHHALEVALARQGFGREGKAFKPHLTVARIRHPRNTQPLIEDFMRLGFADESFSAGEVIVMRSQLSPQGSIYTPQAVIPLKG